MHSSGVLTISLGAIRDNFKLCQQQVGADCVVAPAVKANAYGLGLEQVAPALWDAGAQQYFVATLEEGVRLRGILPNAKIAVLNGVLPDTMIACAENNLIPVLNAPEQALLANEFSKRDGLKFKSILHVDTGMNRLGFSFEELQSFFAAPENYQGLEIETVMSHFSSADAKDSDFTERQNEVFLKVLKMMPLKTSLSLANSAGIFRDEKFHYDMVRPGMGLYGLNPAPHRDNPMRRVVSLDVPVLQVHSVTPGESCGYGETYRFEKGGVLATVSLGYADGFLRALSNKGSLYWNGTACPVRGRVSMDTVIVEIGHLPESQRPVLGDMMEVLGDNQSADDLADAAGTIGYEILTSLGGRYKRIYKN